MCYITIHLLPNAKQSGIVSFAILQNDTIYIKMKVHAPQKKSKANKAMLTILAERLSLNKSSLKMLSKHSSPIKKIYIDKDCKEIIELFKRNNPVTL